ncbi:protein of unknown function [Bradyrhizobium vignae]|uniref:Uncharacterized protein n=1 Tax=Bradyrhizobium vignae TaxID=1549949 RepID=A0A2U3Q2B9_9BRAD|nr:protein of unknown function [Bradyrhizobium vignae]
MEANSVRNSPTVEAPRARLFTPANRKNLAFMTSLPLYPPRPALAGMERRGRRNNPRGM